MPSVLYELFGKNYVSFVFVYLVHNEYITRHTSSSQYYTKQKEVRGKACGRVNAMRMCLDNRIVFQKKIQDRGGGKSVMLVRLRTDIEFACDAPLSFFLRTNKN
jgi:hypothetical protein